MEIALLVGTDEIAGASTSVRSLQRMIDRVADSTKTLLILGESGTGKTFLARAIHRQGRRSDKPFVTLNCAETPSDLLEARLFGHARRNSPSTVSDFLGAFREAEGGTLLLDEIDAMPLVVQCKLLQALQDRVVTPVGGKSVPMNVRTIAATGQDLELAVKQNRFCEDLFYWQGLALVHLPPLRERLADILPLAEHFLTLAAGRKPPKRLSVEAARRLLAHDWPRNVRELREAIERVASLGRRPVLNAAAFDFLTERTERDLDWLSGDLPTAVARLETAMIRQALTACGGMRSEAADRLNITRQLLCVKMHRYGLDGLESDVSDSNSSAGGLGYER